MWYNCPSNALCPVACGKSESLLGRSRTAHCKALHGGTACAFWRTRTASNMSWRGRGGVTGGVCAAGASPVSIVPANSSCPGLCRQVLWLGKEASKGGPGEAQDVSRVTSGATGASLRRDCLALGHSFRLTLACRSISRRLLLQPRAGAAFRERVHLHAGGGAAERAQTRLSARTASRHRHAERRPCRRRDAGGEAPDTGGVQPASGDTAPSGCTIAARGLAG